MVLKLNKNFKEDLFDVYGKISYVNGYHITSIGPDAAKGDLCSIRKGEKSILCEVIGFSGKEKFLMPIESLSDVKEGDKVYKESRNMSVDISEDYLGCILNGIGEIIKDNNVRNKKKDKKYIYDKAPLPTERGFIDTVFKTGIKAIDGLLTIGMGQRIGIFAGSGVGKTTLLNCMLSNNNGDINVIALIGERGRELNEYIKTLGSKMENTIIVSSTSDESPFMRLKCAYTATAISEYFRDKGKNVLLMMDSLTRFCMAQREIGLNTGEPPTTKGYPPSVFSVLPELLERSGKNRCGSITGIYNVLVENDDMNEIISDTARGILDGHIVLSRDLAHSNHYPAIDVLSSISRVMDNIVTKEHMDAASNAVKILTKYKEKEDFINLRYKEGTNTKVDNLIKYNKIMQDFLIQSKSENVNFDSSVNFLKDNFIRIDEI